MGTTGSEVPFLSEGNLPKSARLARLSSSSSAAQEEDRQLAEALTRSQTDTANSEVAGPSEGEERGDTVVSETAVQEIMASGFTREQAVAELRQCGGDMAKALGRLIAHSFKF